MKGDLLFHRTFDESHQVIVGIAGGDFGIVGLDAVGRAEQEARLARLDHRQIVEAVAGGNGLKAAALQRADGGELGLLTSEVIAGDRAVVGDDQLVAEDRGVSEFLHQGLGELGEGIAQDDRLSKGTQLIHELLRPGHRVDRGDGILDLLQTQAVLL